MTDKNRAKILFNGSKYKIQIWDGWWIFKRWRDLGKYPLFEVFVVNYYNTQAEAEEGLKEYFEGKQKNKDSNNWMLVTKEK